MRTIRAASAALLGATALALTAPVALAAEDGTATLFTVSPSTVAPGGRVALSASGCPTTATASSAVFDTVTIRPGTSESATVSQSARPGAQYAVQFTCGSQRGTFNLSVAGTSTPTISSTVTPQGVRGGLGGSVGGPDGTTFAVGGALVVAAATATGLVVRRRTRPHRH
jgi:hypothetical protein